MIVHFVRHGSTSLNSQDRGEDRLRGWLDVPLSAKGLAEACDTAKGLVGCGAQLVVSSDLTRARQTANIIAAALGCEMLTDFGLRPWDVGEAAGRRSAEVHPLLQQYAQEKPGVPVPGGESFSAFLDRCSAAVELILDAEVPAVAVVHYRVLAVLQYVLGGSHRSTLFSGVRVPPPCGSLRVELPSRRLLA